MGVMPILNGVMLAGLAVMQVAAVVMSVVMLGA